jgi:TolB-like protein
MARMKIKKNMCRARGIMKKAGTVFIILLALSSYVYSETYEKSEVQPPENKTINILQETGKNASEDSPPEIEEKRGAVPDGSGEEESGADAAAVRPVAPAAGPDNRVAIFPFDNMTDNMDVMKHVLPTLIQNLGKKGFEVVDEGPLNSFICKERVRTAGYVSAELAGKIRKEFNVSKILTGAIISFSDEDVPEFGILARLIDASDGTILWADYASATGEDFIGILGLGRLKTIFSLVPKVMDKLFASLNIPGLEGRRDSLYRIAVMPFKNNSDFSNAGTIAMYMFMVELIKSREFRPVEFGSIRDSIIELRIRNRGEISYQHINTLSQSLEVRGILVGVVDTYSDGIASASPPVAGMTVRLIDSSDHRIVWYNSGLLTGEDSLIALDWGRIRSVHAVAYQLVSNLVEDMGKKNLQ